MFPRSIIEMMNSVDEMMAGNVMPVIKKIKILNKLGLHARPAAVLVQALSLLDCEIFIEKDDGKVNGKSIMGVMMLAAEYESEITVYGTGPDAQKAIEEVERIVQTQFDE